MKNSISLLVLLFLSISININTQVIQEWVARYNGTANGSDFGRAMVIDNNGNLFVTGTSQNPGSSWDVCTIKYNSSGVQQWVSFYAGPAGGEDDAWSIALDLFGNVYVTGSVGRNPNPPDYITIKYNSSGAQQWAVSYNGPDNEADVAYSIAADNSGNVYVTGRSVANGRNDYYTIKYSTLGVQLWAARYDGQLHLNDEAYQIKLDSLNNVYVTGGIDELGGVSENYGTIKYNSAGVQAMGSNL